MYAVATTIFFAVYVLMSAAEVFLVPRYFLLDESPNIVINLAIGENVWKELNQHCDNYFKDNDMCMQYMINLNLKMYGAAAYAPSLESSTIEDYSSRRVDVIRYLQHRFDYKSYLEIGCHSNETFGNIDISGLKIGVDPVSGGTLRMTSDEFFAINTNRFDLIFVDGLHEANQVYRDVLNALAVLNDGGSIVMHDCNPLRYLHQVTPRLQDVDIWNGDTWRAVVLLRQMPDIDITVLDFDNGVGVIRKRPNRNPLPQEYDVRFNSVSTIEEKLDMLSWDDLHLNRNVVIPLVSWKLFRDWL